MLHMETDFHSPSFRAMRYSSKRARSPEVGGNSPLDRPLKRPLLTVASEIVNMPSTTMAYEYYFTGGKPGNSSIYPSEDWVRQTDHLSIESPLIGTNVFLRKSPLPDDDDVNMELEDGTATNHVQGLEAISAQHVSPAQTPFDRVALHPPQRPLSQSYSKSPERLASTTIQPAGSAINDPPSISAPPSVTYLDPEPACAPTRPSTPTSNSPMMVLSPLPSYMNVPSPKRQRFTMGPRADCEKCRLGVKGHWVHY